MNNNECLYKSSVSYRQAVLQVMEDLLLSLAFKNSNCGTVYIRDAVVFYTMQDEGKCVLRESVYPQVAKIHDTTAERVNKGIRHAITVCYNSGQLKKLNGIFHYPLISNTYAPTNSELIATLSLLVRRLVQVDNDGNAYASRISFSGCEIN